MRREIAVSERFYAPGSELSTEHTHRRMDRDCPASGARTAQATLFRHQAVRRGASVFARPSQDVPRYALLPLSREKPSSHLLSSRADGTDGGLKRLRIYGHPTSPLSTPLTPSSIPALPLTVEAFKPFGSVIQGFSLPTSAPKGIEVSVANQGTAAKFHRMALVDSSAKVCVERHDAVLDVSAGGVFEVKEMVKCVTA